MGERETLERELKASRTAGWPVENVQMPLDEAKKKIAAFMKVFWPLIKDSAEARGIPPYLVAAALRAMADGYDSIPMKEEPRKE